MNSSAQRIHEVIHTAAADITPEQLQWHPEGKWSVADVLEHLSLTYSGTRIVLDRCAQEGTPSARTASWKDRIRTFVVVTLGYLPAGRKAPAGTVPKGSMGSEVIQNFDQQLAAMDQAIDRCERRFGSGVKLVNHPILGPLTAPQWRKFHLVHARHHAKQINSLKRRLAGKK